MSLPLATVPRLPLLCSYLLYNLPPHPPRHTHTDIKGLPTTSASPFSPKYCVCSNFPHILIYSMCFLPEYINSRTRTSPWHKNFFLQTWAFLLPRILQLINSWTRVLDNRLQFFWWDLLNWRLAVLKGALIIPPTCFVWEIHVQSSNNLSSSDAVETSLGNYLIKNVKWVYWRKSQFYFRNLNILFFSRILFQHFNSNFSFKRALQIGCYFSLILGK